MLNKNDLINIFRNGKKSKADLELDDDVLNLIRKDKGNVLIVAKGELWLSCNPNTYNWSKFGEGSICVIKDMAKRSYTFRLYKSPMLLWEHKLDKDLTYSKLTENFYYFSSKDLNVGFNFISTESATEFSNMVNKIIGQKKERAKLRESVKLSHLSTKMNFPEFDPSKFDGKITNFFNSLALNKPKAIDKATISNPCFFKHVNHVGIDQNQNTQTDELVNQILECLEIEPNNQRFKAVETFIDTNGGYEQTNKQFKNYKRITMIERQKSIPSSDSFDTNDLSSNNLSDTSNTTSTNLIEPIEPLIINKDSIQINSNPNSSNDQTLNAFEKLKKDLAELRAVIGDSDPEDSDSDWD